MVRALIYLVVGLSLIAVLLLYLSQPVLAEHPQQGASIVDPARLQTHVRMLSETLAPRDYTHRENLERVAAYIRQEFTASGGHVSEQEFKAEEQAYRNVIVVFCWTSKTTARALPSRSLSTTNIE